MSRGPQLEPWEKKVPIAMKLDPTILQIIDVIARKLMMSRSRIVEESIVFLARQFIKGEQNDSRYS